MRTAFCFDLDGTVTKEEILPILSKEIGLYQEIEALTEATLKGVIPFETSFKLRCRILSEIPINRVQEIISKVVLNDKIVEFIKKNKNNCYIITGNLDIWINKLADKIGSAIYSSKASLSVKLCK
ncbi:HAD-IB family phosphatase [Pseudomonadota bacterium]